MEDTLQILAAYSSISFQLVTILCDTRYRSRWLIDSTACAKSPIVLKMPKQSRIWRRRAYLLPRL